MMIVFGALWGASAVATAAPISAGTQAPVSASVAAGGVEPAQYYRRRVYRPVRVYRRPVYYRPIRVYSRPVYRGRSFTRCRVVNRRVWNGYRMVNRRVRVCR